MTNAPEPNPSPAQVAIPVIEYSSRAFLLRRQQALRRIERVLRTDPATRTEIDAIGGLATALTIEPEDPIALAYTERFLSYQNTVALNQFFGNPDVPIPEFQEVAQDIKGIIKVATDIKDELNDCCAEIKQLLKDLRKQVDQAEKDLTDQINRKASEVIETTSENVVNGVVGESYYRYIATTTFMPTLIMLFNEKSDQKYKRRCQFKFKVLKASEEIEESFIEMLRNEFKALRQRHFWYGNTRTTYVSTDKRIRNVIYAKNKQEATNLLEFIYPLLGQTFEDQNVSYTVGRNRAAFHKRKDSLDGIPASTVDYSGDYYMELRRVVLHVSALEKPILIYRNDQI